MANGNGWVKPVVIGVAIFVLGAVIVGSGKSTMDNTVGRGKLEIQVEANKEVLVEQKAAIAKIPVMAERVKDLKEDMGELKGAQRQILEELRK